jgi:hypothetical protein
MWNKHGLVGLIKQILYLYRPVVTDRFALLRLMHIITCEINSGFQAKRSVSSSISKHQHKPERICAI